MAEVVVRGRGAVLFRLKARKKVAKDDDEDECGLRAWGADEPEPGPEEKAPLSSWDSGRYSERPAKWRRTEEPREKVPPGKWVKITNVPKELTEKYLKELFHNDSTTVVSASLDGAVAWVRFEKSAQAHQVAKTYDNGEINNSTIGVTQERKGPDGEEDKESEEEKQADDKGAKYGREWKSKGDGDGRSDWKSKGDGDGRSDWKSKGDGNGRSDWKSKGDDDKWSDWKSSGWKDGSGSKDGNSWRGGGGSWQKGDKDKDSWSQSNDWKSWGGRSGRATEEMSAPAETEEEAERRRKRVERFGKV